MRNASIAIVAIICIGLPSTTYAQQDGSSEVLIIPLSGKVRGKLRKAPKRFTQTLAKLAESSGTRTMSARVAKSDITTLVGCSEESNACYAEVAATLGVNELVFGKVKKGKNGKLEVTLTRVHPNSAKKTRTRTFVVSGRNMKTAEKEFGTEAEKFLAEKVVETPEPTPPPVTTQPPAKKPGFSFSRVKGYTWGITIGGVASFLVGGALLSLASSKQSDVDDAAADSVADLERLRDLESSGKTLSAFGNSMLIVGAAASLAGAYLIYTQGSAKPEEKRTISVGPTARGRGVAFSLSGRF